MKHLKAIAAPLTCALMAACLILPLGCEDDPSTTDVDAWFDAHPFVSDPRSGPYELLIAIEPESASISYIGQQVTFYAQGGPSSYSWDVSNPGNGTITPSAQSDTATYTVSQLAPNTVIVYDSRGHAGLAEVSVSGGVGALDIVPATFTVTVSTNAALDGTAIGLPVNFKAIGGTTPYIEWDNSNPNIGTITSVSGPGDSEIEFTVAPFGTGNTTILVKDSAGHTDTATVTVQFEAE